ncbi:hypothetical protein [Duganella vulcania]|uniref:Uncharacterized protein n=1 Tax=Duganella vulcania TaxID=2692166 RepID=A0A845GU56_9BURK|nr:hypothetical protein [Duganella vulcania]MYM97824.1 hypothetical protein [Duganella vulcania]
MKILSIFIWSTAILSISSYAAPLDDLSAAEKELTTIFVKEAGGTITTEQGQKKEWRYPYFVGNTASRLTRFNTWLRETSIRELFPEDDALAEKALKSKDRQVIAMLKTDKAAQDASAEAATIDSGKRFGTLFFLTTQNVYHGARYYINVDSAIYDYVAGKEIDIASLFVAGAEQELTGLLKQAIRKSLEKASRESSACLRKNKKNPGYNCPESNINIQQCIDSALFRWSWVNIKDSRHLRYDVPYMPDITAECGYEDGFEIHGDSVERLFLEPARFKNPVSLKIPPTIESPAKR